MLLLAIVGLGVTAILVAAFVFLIQAWWTTPIPVLGMGSVPDQPVAFSHTVHVQDSGIQCEFCHRNVTKGDAATVPAVTQCIFCHREITGATDTAIAEIDKLLAYAGLEPENTPSPSITPGPIDWNKVHIVPDHVQFAHEPHIRVFTDPGGTSPAQQEVRALVESQGITPVEAACSTCHGTVRQMVETEQVRSLKMGDCVNCHRKNDAPTGCATCHY